MKKSNKSFKEIDAILGLNHGKSRMIYHRASWKRDYHKGGSSLFWFYGLSRRAYGILFDLGIESREDTVKALKEFRLIPGKVRNYGMKTHIEVLKWAGLDHYTAKEESSGMKICCPHCGKSFRSEMAVK